MTKRNPALLGAGLLCLGIGVVTGLLIANPPFRYAISLTALALGFGLLRRSFRID
jgi:hypothetical protein